MREAAGCGAGPGLRDARGAERAATFVLTPSEKRHARGGRFGLEPRVPTPGAESALVRTQPVRSRPGSSASSQLARRLLASLQGDPLLFPSPYAKWRLQVTRKSSGLCRNV